MVILTPSLPRQHLQAQRWTGAPFTSVTTWTSALHPNKIILCYDDTATAYLLSRAYTEECFITECIKQLALAMSDFMLFLITGRVNEWPQWNVWNWLTDCNHSGSWQGIITGGKVETNWIFYNLIKCSSNEHFLKLRDPGGRLNKKDGLTRYGDSHVKDKTS